jgi:hypothetical protein
MTLNIEHFPFPGASKYAQIGIFGMTKILSGNPKVN